MARSMLEHRHVSKKFWAEAINTAIYLLNWSPTVAVKGKTPEEAWSGRKPRISHLKIFGSLAYVWILDASRTKLDAKSQKLMLAGYSSLHKAYRLIDIETSRLLYSRDVVFDEQRGPFMPVSLVPDSTDQSMKARDLGVSLPLGPSAGRAPAAQVAPVVPVIPVQTPLASPPRSPRYADASPDFDQDSSDEEPDHRAPLDHKAYHLIDIETSRLLYSRDVVFDEQRGPFMPVSLVPNSADQSMKAHDLGDRLLLGPSVRRAPAAQVAPVVPLIPVQTPSASPPGSPRYADASPDFDPDSSNEEPDHRAPPDNNVGPPLQPKWWARTLADLRDDELIEGRTARKKSKPTDTVNIALMAKIHSVFEP